MKTLIMTIILSVATLSFANACDHSWQTASDGSRCGGRAADQRAGGR